MEGNNVLCPCKTASHWFYYQQDSCFTKGFCQVQNQIAKQMWLLSYLFMIFSEMTMVIILVSACKELPVLSFGR